MINDLTDIADAVAAELISPVGTTWSIPFSPVRLNVPRSKREQMSNLLVTVVPKSRVRTRFNRQRVAILVETYIGVEMGLTGDTNAESDPLIALGQQISDYFAEGRQLASFTATPATCVSNAFGNGIDSPWFSLKMANEALTYTGIITLGFQFFRSVP